MQTARQGDDVKPYAWTEVVRGTIIGPDAKRYRYKFYTEDGELIHYNFVHFNSDAEAVEWFKRNYPDHYARGVEMRAWTN